MFNLLLSLSNFSSLRRRDFWLASTGPVPYRAVLDAAAADCEIVRPIFCPVDLASAIEDLAPATIDEPIALLDSGASAKPGTLTPLGP